MSAKYDVTPHSILIDCQPSETWCQVKKKGGGGGKALSQRLRGGRLQGLLIIPASAVLLIDPPELPPPESSLHAFCWGKKKKCLIHPRSLLSAANNLFCILPTSTHQLWVIEAVSESGRLQCCLMAVGSRMCLCLPRAWVCVSEQESQSKAGVDSPIERKCPRKNGNSPCLERHRMNFSHLGGAIDQPRCIFGEDLAMTVYWQRCHLLKSWPC